MAAIDTLLKHMVSRGASDVHLSSTFKPYLRIHGVMERQEEWPVQTSDGIMAMLTEIMPAHNQRQFEREWDTDFAYEVAGMGRFRVNVFHDRFGAGTVMRLIPSVVPTIEQLNLPRALREFCYLSKGLVLVTGPTGSGKSTTLAAMVDHINRNRTEHVITIEDPIEFIHEPIRCLINQREVHRDTTGFARALRAALREDPDIVLVGEMRDLETVEIAIETAETGHLVFATVHTNSAATTIDRVIDKFPAQRQNQIRSLLGDSLKGVVAQTLCRQIGGGRIAAFEVLVVNIPVASHIRDAKTFMIPSVMQTSREIGMQTFGEELAKLVLHGKITPEEAYIKAVDKEDIRISLENNGIALDFLKNKETAGPDRTNEVQLLISQLRATLKERPDDVNGLNDLAWVLSTTAVDALRNGREAVRLAERAAKLTKHEEVGALDTLSAAYAETGTFRRAVETAQQALELANEKHLAEMIGPLSMRLKLYRDGRAYRDV
ncbi:MAG: PilT/PilU family type 4a pilus ATPase [Kiritimatiellae bacterium]|nr:PilT/PilU family type 4a pilus ATPase [Kiritimatiellia bacterium]